MVDLKTLEVEERTLALAFDSEVRLAEFVEGAADTLTLTGSDLADLLAGTGLGLGVNLGPSGAPMELTPDNLDWILEEAPPEVGEAEGAIDAVHRPDNVPPGLLEALDARLATLPGQAEAAYLVAAKGEEVDTLLLVITGAHPAKRSAVAGQIAEGLRFSDVDSPLDITFADPGDPLLLAVARHGIRFDVPKDGGSQMPPGSDPDKPPRLH